MGSKKIAFSITFLNSGVGVVGVISIWVSVHSCALNHIEITPTFTYFLDQTVQVASPSSQNIP